MAIKHKAVVKFGDLILSDDWNAPHVIEDFTILGRHIDNKQIGKDHIINKTIDTDLLNEINWIDFVDRTSDPTLTPGKIWFRRDLGLFHFSPDGTTVEKLGLVTHDKTYHVSPTLPDNDVHKTSVPIDHPDASIPPGKLDFGTWEKIVDTTVSGAAVTSITVTGLDLDAAKAYMILFKVTNPTPSNSDYYLYLNNDTTLTNYFVQYGAFNGTAVTADRVNDPRVAWTPAGQEVVILCWMIRDPGGYVRTMIKEIRKDPASLLITVRGHTWVTKANVTRIDITAAISGAIGIGSNLMIFKVSA